MDESAESTRSRTLRVVVADDHPLFLDALDQLVSGAADLELVGRAADGQELVDIVDRVDPDVVVTDLRMPGLDGINATQRILEHRPGQRILVVTMHDEDALVAAALQAGVRGYALKESPPAVVVAAIRAVGDGLLVLGPGVNATRPPEAAGSAFPGLTPRERELVDLIAAGRTNMAAARTLGKDRPKQPFRHPRQTSPRRPHHADRPRPGRWRAESELVNLHGKWFWRRLREADRDDDRRPCLPGEGAPCPAGGTLVPLAAPSGDGGALGAWLLIAVVAAFCFHSCRRWWSMTSAGSTVY